MKRYFAYIRVSTPKQGVQGSSLVEQRAAIEAYGKRHNLVIAEWFEELETAAKKGRPLFTRMMRRLRRGEAHGVVIHKIDRGARNPRDWADLGEMIDEGLDVHFVHDGLDLHSRGGRLAADIQAVVAADYVRNLRDEVKKGFYGRLKQGLYPLQAPIGYQDMGGGKPKTIDPVKGPLIRAAFELYATGSYNLRTLKAEMFRRGLRTKTGKPVSRVGLNKILRNQFYYGLIRIEASKQTFEGVHAPLVSKELFDQVQDALQGNRRGMKEAAHKFVFRRLIRCSRCGRFLIGERHKERYVYYRCHDPKCGIVSLSERVIELHVRGLLKQLMLRKEEVEDMRDMLAVLRVNSGDELARRQAAITLRLGSTSERLTRLTDALLDGLVDKETFEERKVGILNERRSLQDQLEGLTKLPPKAELISKYLELSNTACIQYQNGLPHEKREIVVQLTSNFTGLGNYPAITLKSPFQEMLKSDNPQYGGPSRYASRTFTREELFEIFSKAADMEVGSNPLPSPSSHPSPRREPDANAAGLKEAA